MIKDSAAFHPDVLSIRFADHLATVGVFTRANYLAYLQTISKSEQVDTLLSLIVGSMEFFGEAKYLPPTDYAAFSTHPIGVGETQVPVLKWSGMLTATALGSVTAYMTDSPLTMATVRPGYCIGARTTGKLRIRALANALATDLVLTVQNTGVDTTTTATIPGGSTSVVVDLAHTANFGATEQLDIKMTNTNGGAAAVAMVTATLEVPA